MEIQHFFDKDTFTLTYVVFDRQSKDAVIIDPVLDYDPASCVMTAKSLQPVLEFVSNQQLNVQLILETHAHADHLSGAQILKRKFPFAKLAIGKGIVEVQSIFKDVFDLPYLETNGHQFDVLLSDQDEYQVGTLSFKVLFTPGHTPACASYLFMNAALFVGDVVFMPDYGTGRCDFPGGSASLMFDSIKEKIYQLNDDIQVFVGHDYMPEGRELRWHTTVGVLKAKNKHLNQNTTKKDFIKFRNDRDRGLSAPRLLYPSVQFNIDAGKMPPANDKGQFYFKMPIKRVD